MEMMVDPLVKSRKVVIPNPSPLVILSAAKNLILLRAGSVRNLMC
jgi:hypothetical protein